MNITVSWVVPPPSLPTTGFYVYYKPWDGVGNNNWIQAAGPLPSGTTSYTITGLNPNTVYRVLVSHECLGEEGALTDESTYINITCPVISVWQGGSQDDRTLATLFYSIYYPDSTHVTSAKVGITTLSAFPNTCPTPSFAPIGRTGFILSGDLCTNPGQFDCNIQSLDFLYPSGLTSAVGYFGLDTLNFQNTCNGTINDPILFQENTSYKFYVETIIDQNIIGIDIDFITNDEGCITFPSAFQWTTGDPVPDYTQVSGSLCYNNCQVDLSLIDAVNQAWQGSYAYEYFTEDVNLNQLPLVDNAGNLITTSDVTYNVYCPVNMTPSLSAGQLAANMGFELIVYNPVPNIAYSVTGLNFTGLNWTQVTNIIANDINANTAFTANVINIAGVDYIKLEPCSILRAEIRITGTGLFGNPIPDIPQVDPTSLSNWGISDAFVYDAGAGDFIYGCRGLSGSDSANIQVTDIANAVTTEYSHPIDIPINQMTLVPQAPPATAYALKHLTTTPTEYHSFNIGIMKNPLFWNDGFVYVTEDPESLIISVYDQTDTLIDTYQVPGSDPIRYIEMSSESGRVLAITESIGSTMTILFIRHDAIGNWTLVNSNFLTTANNVYISAISGLNSFVVQFSTTSTITVAGNPWVNNQWSNQRIVVNSGPLAGSQAVLYNFNPPTQPLFSNNTNTLFLNPTGSTTFDASLLTPGTSISFLGPSNVFDTFYDSALGAGLNQYLNYDIVFESPGPLRGKRFKVRSHTGDSIQVQSYCLGEYYNRNSLNGGALSGFVPGNIYRLYKTLTGGLKYNPIINKYFFSIGKGEVVEIDSVGNILNTFTLLDPAGFPVADGAFQFDVDLNTGTTYAIMRSADMAVSGDSTTSLTSNHIYIIDSSSTPQPAIDGDSRWNAAISGRICCLNDKLHFTTQVKREFITYNLITNTWSTVSVPSIYKKSSNREQIESPVHLTGSKFILTNRLSNASTVSPQTKYLFTNLFVYNSVANTVESVLVGTDSIPYSGPEDSWNASDFGEMFCEYNGFKDYCLGAMSVKTFNGRIYFKQYAEEGHYVVDSYAETGVAQIWCSGRNRTPNPDRSTYRLIRIFNIQSDGSLVPSNRTLHTYRSPRSLKQGPLQLTYSSFYNGVVGVTGIAKEVILINPSNFTGYYGGPNQEFINISLNSLLTLYTNGHANSIVDANRFAVRNTGQIYVFGQKTPGIQQFTYQVYNGSNLLGTTNSVFQSATVGDGTNPGLYNVGAATNYPPVYNPNTNTIWIMGNDNRSTVPNNRIIRIYNADTMAVVQTINLTAAGAVTQGATHLYHNHLALPAIGKMLYYGFTNSKLLVIDESNYSIIFNDTMLSMLNLNRPLALGAQNIGWVVPYSTGFFVDRTDFNTTDEFWAYKDSSGGVSYEGYVHDYITVEVNNQVILNHDLVSNTTLTGFSFGHWKVQSSSPNWNTMNGLSDITVTFGDIIEIAQFDPLRPISKVENLTQGWTYDITNPSHINQPTLPTFNTLNSIDFFAIKADNINLFSGDQLRFTFYNPTYPSCPYINELPIIF